MPDPLLILHLSDLHFGSRQRFASLEPASLGQRCGSGIRERCHELALPYRVQLVVVTGDLADTAKPQEYQHAEEFLTALAAELGVDREHVVFCPGNHDVSWPQCRIVDNQRQEEEFSEEEFRRRLDAVKFLRYEEFYGRFMGSEVPRAGGPFHYPRIRDFPELRLTLAALNSCELESHRPEDHRGHLGEEQCQRLLDAWSTAERRCWLKVALVHHNLGQALISHEELLKQHPAPASLTSAERERWPAVLGDLAGCEGQEFLRRAATGSHAQLVLHGHQHTTAAQTWDWGPGGGLTHILAAGSLGAVLPPETEPNALRLVLLEPGVPRLRSWNLVWDHRAVAPGTVAPGAFVTGAGREDVYEQLLDLPEEFEPGLAGGPLLRKLVVFPVMEQLVEEVLDQEHAAARQLLTEQRYSAALEQYRQLLAKLRRLPLTEQAAGPIGLRLARAQLGVAICLLNLQRPDEARPLLEELDGSILPADVRLSLAHGLAWFGQRARVEPLLEGLPEEQSGPVRQLLALRDDELPDPLLPLPFLQLQAARVLFDRGRLEDAVQLALQALDGPREHRISHAEGLNALMVCLDWTLRDAPGIVQPLATDPDRRSLLVQRLEELLAQDWRDLPAPIPEWIDAWRASFRQATADPGWFEEQDRQAKLEGHAHEPAPPQDAILAQSGPWYREYLRVMELGRTGRYQEALTLVLALVERWPDRVLLEASCAELLQMAGRLSEALVHARRAFAGLPGRGQRLLLVQLLLATGGRDEAWLLLLPQREDFSARRPLARAELILLAQAAEEEEPRLAIACWKQVLERSPQEPHLHLRIAVLHFRLGEHREAAETAWQACDGPASARLTAEELYRCGHWQHLDPLFPREQRRRVEQIIRWLSERFPSDPQAQVWRLELMGWLGDEARDLPPPPLQPLLEQGRLRAVPFAVIQEAFRNFAFDTQRLRETYRLGRLSFEALTRPDRLPAVVLLTELDRPEQPFRLSTPIVPVSQPILPLPTGGELLLGELELLLLQRLNLLDRLQKRLGAGARLLLFEDVYERIEENATRVRDQPGEEAQALHRWVAAGLLERWLRKLPRPAVPALPPVRAPEHRLLRSSLEQALSWHQAVQGRTDRRFLTADFLSSQGALLGLVDLLQIFAWQTPDQIDQLVGQHTPEEWHLPDLVQALIPAPEHRLALQRLARWGFQEALQPADLLDLARREPALLDQAEWITSEPRHGGQLHATQLLTQRYAAAIWQAWCGTPRAGEPDLPLEERTTVTDFLLDRAARLQNAAQTSVGDLDSVTFQSRALDELLLSLTSHSLDQPRASFVPGEADTLVTSPEAPAAQLWRRLGQWAGPDGSRRAALGRVARVALCFLDERSGDADPDLAQIVALSHAALEVEIWHRGIRLLDPELAALSILSANWEERPLRKHGLLGEVEGRPYQFDLEAVLAHGASLLEAGVGSDLAPGSPWFQTQDLIARFSFPLQESLLVPVWAPLEAVLLRVVAPTVFEQQAQQAQQARQAEIRMQGELRDGRLATFLERLAAALTDRTQRRKLARLAALAPWRLVREDPAWFASWGRSYSLLHPFPATLQDLRELLSEPSDLSTVPAAAPFVSQLVARANSGSWQQRPHLTWLATQVPGELSLFAAWFLLQSTPDRAQLAEATLRRLEQQDDRTAGELASGLLVLRSIAAAQPILDLATGTVDLRERVPELTLRLLAPIGAAQTEGKLPRPDCLAAAEPDLLRLCQRIVFDLSRGEPPTSTPELLWLTYRLFQWLVLQLRALPPKLLEEALRILRRAAPPAGAIPVPDLLQPAHFGPEQFDHRLASVLFALCESEGLVHHLTAAQDQAAAELRPLYSKPLEARLAELAARTLTPAEEQLRAHPRTPASDLGWDQPSSIPELALLALLRLDLTSFLRLPVAQRLAWLRQLPAGPADRGPLHPETQWHLWGAMVELAKQLEQEERQLLAERLPFIGPECTEVFPELPVFAAIMLLATGQSELLPSVRQQLGGFLAADRTRELFGAYFLAITEQLGDAWPDDVRAWLEQATREADPVPVALGLGRVVVLGSETVARRAAALMQELNRQPHYREDPRWREVMTVLNLQEQQG